MRSDRLILAVVVASGAVTTMMAQSEAVVTDEATAVTNAPIVVTASRSGRTADEMAANVTVITAAEIEQAGAADLVQALEKLGGVYMRKLSGNPSAAEVSLRGFGETSHGRTLILVNGQRLNTLDMAAPDLLRIPFGSIERIEVVRGPQSVLHGDYASAGVINVITHSGASEPSTTISGIVGSQHTRGASINTTGPIDDRSRYTVDANWLTSDGWRRNSDYETRDVRTSLDIDWNDRFSSYLSVFYNKSNYGMPGALTLAQYRNNPKESTSANDQFRSESWGAALGSALLVGDEGRLALDFTASRRLTDSANDYSAYGYWMYYKGALDTLSLSPSYSDRYTLARVENRVMLGLDFRFDTLEMSYLYSPQIPLWGIVNKHFALDRFAAAAFVENETFISDEISLILGVRAERIRNKPNVNASGLRKTSSTESALAAALIYRPTDEIKTFLRGSTFYHAPFADELVNIWGFPPTVMPLKPETGYTLEAGATVNLAQEWEAGATTFYTAMKNEIVYNPMNFANENYDDTQRYGAELSLRWSRSGWGRAGLFYTFTEAEFDAGVNKGNDLPFVPHHVVSLNGELDVVEDVSLLGSFRAAGNQRHGSDFGNDQRKIAGYGVFDVGVRVTPTSIKGLSLTFMIDNVFNKEYATAGYYGSSIYPANGRTWRVSASYTF